MGALEPLLRAAIGVPETLTGAAMGAAELGFGGLFCDGAAACRRRSEAGIGAAELGVGGFFCDGAAACSRRSDMSGLRGSRSGDTAAWHRGASHRPSDLACRAGREEDGTPAKAFPIMCGGGRPNIAGLYASEYKM